ncbi:hypothetical protein [Noviherbaspirillum pedocola]|uniref:Uncharacterized protein n=1 Tax=Noviherbaspirillum pedocola TaxID=2801341 RepID=A0A934W4P6_9BURK|nr:hypothetical protein [Noviherbaspirillum pedocola]MBK4738761.1 hypothetical protein [Noviherbaspirillum pedocola]
MNTAFPIIRKSSGDGTAPIMKAIGSKPSAFMIDVFEKHGWSGGSLSALPFEFDQGKDVDGSYRGVVDIAFLATSLAVGTRTDSHAAGTARHLSAVPMFYRQHPVFMPLERHEFLQCEFAPGSTIHGE